MREVEGDERRLSALCIRALDQCCRLEKVRGRVGEGRTRIGHIGERRGARDSAGREVPEHTVHQGAGPVAQV